MGQMRLLGKYRASFADSRDAICIQNVTFALVSQPEPSLHPKFNPKQGSTHLGIDAAATCPRCRPPFASCRPVDRKMRVMTLCFLLPSPSSAIGDIIQSQSELLDLLVTGSLVVSVLCVPFFFREKKNSPCLS